MFTWISPKSDVCFINMISSYGLEQHITTATHVSRHILDLIMTRTDDDFVRLCEVGLSVQFTILLAAFFKNVNHHLKHVKRTNVQCDILRTWYHLPLKGIWGTNLQFQIHWMMSTILWISFYWFLNSS